MSGKIDYLKVQSKIDLEDLNNKSDSDISLDIP